MASLTQRSILFYCFIMLILSASCKSSKDNLTYLSDLRTSAETVRPIENNVETRIQPRDVLVININSSSPETNSLFNTGAAQAPGTGGASAAAAAQSGYTVDTNGFIKFPVLGRIQMAGLTVEEASEKVTNLVAENYVKAPIVNVTISNFRITVIGDVRSPQTYTIPSARVNIFEALSLAGDMTESAKRNNVLIVREQNGTRSTIKVDLNKVEALNSPYFYLRQNDIVYVESTKERKRGPNTLSIVLSIVSVVSIALVNFSRFF